MEENNNHCILQIAIKTHTRPEVDYQYKTISNRHEIDTTYIRPTHRCRNETPKSFKMSETLTQAIYIMIYFRIQYKLYWSILNGLIHTTILYLKWLVPDNTVHSVTSKLQKRMKKHPFGGACFYINILFKITIPQHPSFIQLRVVLMF